MTFLILTSKVIDFILLVLISAFVFLFGKNGTGIKLYYAITAALLLLFLFM